MKPVITVRNIGKHYNINHQRGKYVSLRDVITYNFSHPLRFFKHKAKKTLGRGVKEEFWALRGVSFDIMRGEVVGIIGANGAGKSTLLKILTGITPPTEGEIIMQGKIASLLEVGTGFHPELSGRENIFLNGAILGMRRKEIARKFNEIVAFAGIEKFIDTPVKHYSSGMYVRLAFSVAAHMEPDILLVDEVLAVGDAEFQKKCLGKMEEVTRQEGRTIILVSHNVEAIKNLCKRCILLDKGKKVFEGETAEVLQEYTRLQNNRKLTTTNKGEYSPNRRGSGTLSFTNIAMLDDAGVERNTFTTDEVVRFKLSYAVYEQMQGLHTSVSFFSNKAKITDMRYQITPDTVQKGTQDAVTIEVDLHSMRPGEYNLYFWLGDAKATQQGIPTHYDVVDDLTKPLIIRAKDEEEKKLGGMISLPSKLLRS